MKSVILTLLSLVFLVPTAWSQSLSAKDKSAILTALKDQETCWNEGDIDCFMEGYWKSDSLTFTGSSGIVYGWQSTMERYKRRYPGPAEMGKLTFSVLRMAKIDKKTVTLIGKFHLAREIGDLEGYFTLIWKKINGKWLIISDHTS